MKRRWWLWLLLALACSLIIFAVSELTGLSIAGIFGWGALGVLGIFGVLAALMLSAVFVVLPIVVLVKFLLECFISNREILYITLGSVGFCAILVGWILTIRESGWSFLVIMVGFSMGCLAGIEYQRFSDLRKEEEMRQG